MEVLAQSSLLVSITSFAIGFSVLARNVRNKLFLAFAILTTLISAWALFFFLAKFWDSHDCYNAHLLMHIWLAPVSLAFIRTLVKLEDVLSRTLLSVAVVIACVLTGLLALGYENRPVILQIIYFAPGAVVLQLFQLIWLDRRLKPRGIQSPAIRTPVGGLDRRFLIYLGGLLVLATSSLDHVPWLGPVVPSVGNVALTAYLFFLSQAVLQQRFLNFGAIFSRFLILLAMALTLTLVYSMIFTFIEGKPALFFLNSFFVSFLLLMLLEPIRSLVGYLTQRLLTQKHRRLLATLRESQRKLSGVTDPHTLFQSILGASERLLRPGWAALFLLQSDGTLFQRVRTVGRLDAPFADGLAPGGDELNEILSTHPLIEHCRTLRRRSRLPILLDQVLQNEIDRSASRKQREYYASLIDGLRALGANLLIPLFDEGEGGGTTTAPHGVASRVWGFVILRVSSPPEPWGNDWGLLPVIYPYFEQAARAMRSLEIFSQQREKERLAALGEMAAGLAHEIRNPLGAIKGAAQFLQTSGNGDAGAPLRSDSRFLQIIVEETDRLNRVVSQFLDYSKPWSVEMQPVELVPWVERTLDVLRPSLGGAIRLELSPARAGSDSGIRVMGSPEQLRQVLMNLIQNSARAVEGRPNPTVRVSLDVDPLRPHEAVIGVEDNGRGIRRENLDKLFIPFFTTSPGGTGLGLSISQRIVEAHRGRIEVASEEGRFTRFSVVLPAVGENHGSRKSPGR